MATAKKLPSGNWRVLIYIGKDADGKRKYDSFTASTKKEAEFLSLQCNINKSKKNSNDDAILKTCFDEYIKMKEFILSPSTIYTYKLISKNKLSSLMQLKISKIDNIIIQKAINEDAKLDSPKTLRNSVGLLSVVLKYYKPDFQLNISLPQKIKSDIYIPTDNDIKKIIENSKAKDLEIPILLAAFGSLRRSEICALTKDDIAPNGVMVTKAMVKSDKDGWIIKGTKTPESNRLAMLPDFVLKKLEQVTTERLVNYSPNNLSTSFTNFLKKLKITPFRFHDLRHYWTSIVHAIGMPDQYIMKNGGWNSMKTPRSVYMHIIEDKNKTFGSIINDYFEKMQHE